MSFMFLSFRRGKVRTILSGLPDDAVISRADAHKGIQLRKMTVKVSQTGLKAEAFADYQPRLRHLGKLTGFCRRFGARLCFLERIASFILPEISKTSSMKRIIVIVAVIFMASSSCKKDNPVPAPTTKTVSVKYSLVTLTPLKDTSANAVVKYTDASGQLVTATDFIPGSTSWSKTISVTVTSGSTRPFKAEFKTQGASKNFIYLVGGNSGLTAAISVDDVVVDYYSSGGVAPFNYFDSFAMSYIVD
jgi:hypothetical protein